MVNPVFQSATCYESNIEEIKTVKNDVQGVTYDNREIGVFSIIIIKANIIIQIDSLQKAKET